jgi:hypothetical protein
MSLSDRTEYSAVSRCFSPDMKRRWLPTTDGKVVAGGTLPFSGFDTRAEAVSAAEDLRRRSQHPVERQ